MALPTRRRRHLVAVDSPPHRHDVGLAALPDPRFAEYWETRDRALRNELLLEHRWLARYCSLRFALRGEMIDELVPVAQFGMLKAIERFDPYGDVGFPAFAVPTMLGELRRRFPDRT
jgi:RNA polymerase sigma-B factor